MDLKNYAKNVFDDRQMKARLSSEDYASLRNTVLNRVELPIALADKIADAMKCWAVENGATHFCHWFVPMTGATAEKHDAFLAVDGTGNAIWEFSGKHLVKGEPDASSFPSGGLRCTFEARGYTAWDVTSPAFLKEKSLYIPTAFCSYNGDALDMRIPLIRSAEAVNESALRLFRQIGLDIKKVEPYVGAEQEYFLVEREMFARRPDLICTGRTLLGKRAPKGQELDDHYCGSIKPRISAFMAELDERLWELGVPVKTKHNEVAPCQHEIVPIFSPASAALDSNHLIMETMKRLAEKHGFVALLHEKPFKDINGSGKHNNWSLLTDTGVNLCSPGKEPESNLPFLLTLAAVIRGVNQNSELLRLSVASAGNDHRLGSHEAPPGIVSIYLGDELNGVFEQITTGVHDQKKRRSINTGTLAPFKIDTSDRNRTSPLAFSGNRFEFRMIGSSASISGSITMLNAVTADSFNYLSEQIEKRGSSREKVLEIIKETFISNARIIFNGDNYTAEWVKEAEKRGLPVISNTVDAVCQIMERKSQRLLTSLGIYSETEIASRYEILLETYIRTINIEARTLNDIIGSMVIPAVNSYLLRLSKLKATIGAGCGYIAQSHADILELAGSLYSENNRLAGLITAAMQEKETLARAAAFRDTVLTSMERVREYADELERVVDKALWPLPSYADILFST